MKTFAWLIGAAVFFCILSFGRAEPKAYDLVKYRGKAGGAAIAFDFGSGYPEASEASMTLGGKKIKLRTDSQTDTGFTFKPEKPGVVKTLTVKMEPEGPAPAKVKGSYTTGEKTVEFTLTQSK